jgi:sulfur carrier protein
MNIFINQKPFDVPTGATLADAVLLQQAKAPFAAAVNLQFVPNTQYAQTLLHSDDRIDIIAPITGG